MKRLLILLAFSILVNIALSQPGPAYSCKSFILTNNRVWGLFTDGSLKIFRTDNGQPDLKILIPRFKAKSLLKDASGNVIAVTDYDIKRYDSVKNIWTTVRTGESPIYGVAFNSKNRCFLISNNGITDVSINQSYIPAHVYYTSEMGYHSGWVVNEPAKCFVDKDDYLWICNDHGEWGSDLFIFNTITHSFIRLANNTYTAADEYMEFSSNIYLTGHDVSSSYIEEFEPYKNEGERKGHIIYQVNQPLIDDYVGSCAINPLNGFLYRYSKEGLIRTDLKKSGSMINNWSVIKEFKLKGGKPKSTKDLDEVQRILWDAKKPRMVTMDFTNDGKLVFISQYDGLGIFDGKRITILDKRIPYE